MESKSDQSPLVVVVGETASGKSALALELAQQFNGEIVAADSRTLYRGMDIGTAKPTKAQQDKVRHHIIDVSTPDRPITASDFKSLAESAIKDIATRGKVPFLVGGTGLYIDAIIYDFSFARKGNEKERYKWQQLSVEELQEEIRRRDIALPVNARNPRHLIRQLETGGIVKQDKKLRENTLIIGLAVGREELKVRIAKRVDQMFNKGLVDEVGMLSQNYTWDHQAMRTIGYREFKDYSPESQTLETLKEQIKRNTTHYAKRQRSWFKRNKSIHWVSQREEVVDLITTFLNK